MSNIRRVRVGWTGIAGTPYLSTFYFAYVSGQASNISTAVNSFLNTFKPQWVPGLTARQEQDQDLIDEVTGQLVGSEAGLSPVGYAGTNAGDPLPTATQGLLRLSTTAYVGGRNLKGHLFLPGPGEGANTNGIPVAGYLTALDAAGAALVAATTSPGPWLVWSRKNGTSSPVTTVNTWAQWAVLRSRRD